MLASLLFSFAFQLEAAWAQGRSRSILVRQGCPVELVGWGGWKTRGLGQGTWKMCQALPISVAPSVVDKRPNCPGPEQAKQEQVTSSSSWWPGMSLEPGSAPPARAESAPGRGLAYSSSDQLRASASRALNSLSQMSRRQGNHLKDCALLPKRRGQTSKESVDYCRCPRLKLNGSTPPYYLADGLRAHKKEKVGIRSNKESLPPLHIPVVVRVIWGSHSHSRVYLFNN